MKIKKLINPGRRRRARNRKRKLSPKQIKFFGTPAQKAALKNSRKRKRRKNISSILSVRNPGRKRRRKVVYRDAAYKIYRTTKRRRKNRRRKNLSLGLGELKKLIGLKGKRRSKRRTNKSMAKRRRTRNRRRKNVVYRRRIKRGSYMYTSNPRRRRRNRRHYSRRRRHANPTVYRRRRRHHRTANRRHYRRHRNPGFLSGTMGKIAGYLGGFALTAFLDSAVAGMGFSFNTGLIGLGVTAVIAYGQGRIVGGVMKNRAFGADMTIGGLAYVALKAIKYFVPSLSIPGFSGMGILGGSSFYVPQANVMGNMGQFQPIGMSMPAMAASGGKSGMGRLRRGPRLM